MTIDDIVRDHAAIESELLLAHALKRSREFVYIHRTTPLTKQQLKLFRSLAKRRTKGEPVAYILGYKDFYGLRFRVNRHVLIPRPETEWIVERALSTLGHPGWLEKRKDLSILDLGTGSGCIAISLATQLAHQHIKIFASDISKAALHVAKKNARHHKVNIQCIHSSLFKNIKQQFDLIVANLPYVPLRDYKKLYQNLQYEPKSALTDGSNNFVMYEKFFRHVRARVNDHGIILLEIDPAAKEAIKIWSRHYLPKSKIYFYKDLRKLWRYAVIET